jgi:SP family myo-inositol transporter-like MFS transporter 13
VGDVGMPVCLVLAAIAFKWVPIDQKTLQLTDYRVGWLAILVLVAMIGFVAFYAVGLGCVPWQANEFLPIEVRVIGTMMIKISIWGPNIIVSSTVLSLMKGISPSGLFTSVQFVFLGLGLRYLLLPRGCEHDTGGGKGNF